MRMKEHPIHQNGTIHNSAFRALSLITAGFILILFLIIGIDTAQSQEKSSVVATTPQKDTLKIPSGAVPQAPCVLSPIIVPTLPKKIPGYTEMDPETKLHVTGNAQVIDLESYHLEVTGKVSQPPKLKYDDLRCMPGIEDRPTLICPGFFEDTATWAGASLTYILERAGVQEGANGIRLVSADGYEASLSLKEALSVKNFLAYELENKPIPILHGFPVRAIFPDLPGNRWVKWLVRIEVE